MKYSVISFFWKLIITFFVQTNYDNITIRNCTLVDWDSYAVYFQNGENNTIEFLEIYGNSYGGVSFASDIRGTVKNCTIHDLTYIAIHSNFGHNLTVENNTIYNYDRGLDYGVYLSNTRNASVSKNRITNLTNHGIYISNTWNTTLWDNFLNNTNNVEFKNTIEWNRWNITEIAGTRIYGSGNLGGNYWANASGSGYSDSCTDGDADNFCDDPLILTNMVICTPTVNCSGNTDYLPYA